jgi:hypothetical protein
MPRPTFHWTQPVLCTGWSPRYSLDSWTLLVRSRKTNLPTFEFTIARIDKTRERKRSEIDANGPKNVLGGLDVVAEAEGLSSTV